MAIRAAIDALMRADRMRGVDIDAVHKVAA
jgi:hypothetical protein